MKTSVVSLLFGVLTFAPSSASNFTTSAWPRCAAMKTGVQPPFLGVSTFAPSLASSLTTSTWPSCAAT